MGVHSAAPSKAAEKVRCTASAIGRTALAGAWELTEWPREMGRGDGWRRDMVVPR
ncbi:hypothetical protein D3C78_1901920 [compost metagenome]